MNIMVLEKLWDSFLGNYPKTGSNDANKDTDQELDNVYICQNEQLIKPVNVKICSLQQKAFCRQNST